MAKRNKRYKLKLGRKATKAAAAVNPKITAQKNKIRKLKSSGYSSYVIHEYSEISRIWAAKIKQGAKFQARKPNIKAFKAAVDAGVYRGVDDFINTFIKYEGSTWKSLKKYAKQHELEGDKTNLGQIVNESIKARVNLGESREELLEEIGYA